MSNNIYFQPDTVIQSIYYNFRLKNPPDVKFFPFIDQPEFEFLARYQLLNTFHSQLHPFQFVKPCDNVVHVGFDREYLNKGMSFPLIFASLISEKGSVLAIEADKKNIEAMSRFIHVNHVKNIIVVEGAVWNQKEKLEFIVRKDWSPLSIVKIVSFKGGGNDEEIGEKKLVLADTLDEYILKNFKNKNIDFISITTNGAEPEIIDGAKETLRLFPNVKIAIALAYMHFSYKIRKELCNRLANMNYKITIGNAPHDPWQGGPFLFACAVKLEHDELVKMGFQKSNWEEIESFAHKLEKLCYERSLKIKDRIVRLKNKIIQTLF